VSHLVVDAAFAVHSQLGAGLLESVYEACLAYELRGRALKVARQVALPIRYRGVRLDGALRLDLVVENCVIVEIKAIDDLAPVHTAQVLTYLKLSGLRLGLLINFNVARIREGIRRVIL
jgi:GxxExxY protein